MRYKTSYKYPIIIAIANIIVVPYCCFYGWSNLFVFETLLLVLERLQLRSQRRLAVLELLPLVPGLFQFLLARVHHLPQLRPRSQGRVQVGLDERQTCRRVPVTGQQRPVAVTEDADRDQEDGDDQPGHDALGPRRPHRRVVLVVSHHFSLLLLKTSQTTTVDHQAVHIDVNIYGRSYVALAKLRKKT